MISVSMPKLGLTMDEGTVLSWYKQAGELVKAGEPLLSVETDKVSIDVEAPGSGQLLKIIAEIGSVVPLGGVMAYIGEPGEVPVESEWPAIQPSPHTVLSSPPESGVQVQDAAPVPIPGPMKISPIARKLAQENNIDLAAVQGSGPGGRIVEADIQAILDSRSRQAVLSETSFTLHDLSSTRKVTARRMTESWQSIPHFYLGVEINAAPLVHQRQALLSEYESAYGVHLTYSDLLSRALAITLPRHPLFNAAYHSGTQVKIFSQINLGIAIASGPDLVVAVIHQADQLPLWEIARLRQSLVAKAQAHRLEPGDVSGATFTLTNLGMYGIDDFAPIINPGQSAILAAGAIVDRPAIVSGQLAMQPGLRLTLAVDHRVADGAAGALFLKDLRALLESPFTM